MSATPKWYCRNKSQPTPQTFGEISKLGNELRRITKRIVIDVKIDLFCEHDSLLDECERIIELYWNLKYDSENREFLSLSKKIKRSPYNSLLMRKYKKLMELNDRRFCQLTFVLKKTLTFLLRKGAQSEVWLNWALQITQLYNKCQQTAKTIDPETDNDAVDKNKENKASNSKANVCSNMYPGLLLQQRPIEFAYLLQFVSQTRIEQTSLDLIFGLFNMSVGERGGGGGDGGANDQIDDDTWPEHDESNCSSLEILRILTLNFTNDGEFQQYYDSEREYGDGIPDGENDDIGSDGVELIHHTIRSKHTEYFLQKERNFIANLLARANELCPIIFTAGEDKTNGNVMDFNVYIVRGLRLIWSYVGIILDHIILWWIDTPISCYPLSHIDTIRNWFYAQHMDDIPEPVYSTLRGIGEVLTNFVGNNMWDQMFRLTLISGSCPNNVIENSVEHFGGSTKNQNGTPTGIVWVSIFGNLINLSNNYFPKSEGVSSSTLPVAEQIPILHRIDHSVHSMRLWVKEQAKLLCNEWKMDRFFKMLEHDVKVCLEVFITFKLPKLTADLSDILMLVCVALRTKLVCEVNVNIGKLKKTTDECIEVLSEVCRTLSLAQFSLCFPPNTYWHQNANPDNNNVNKFDYVGYVLDEVFSPAINATQDVNILKLILQLICEAWLDYIYQKRIKFSVTGAICLLKDFDSVRDWILKCNLLQDRPDHVEKLTNHEVLRMCKGVGKILLRKPEDVISIIQSPKFDKRKGDEVSATESQLPSEMFVSNQKRWLQLRARGNGFLCLSLCCGSDGGGGLM